MKKQMMGWMASVLILVASRGQGALYTGSLSYTNDVSYGFTANAAALANSWRRHSALSWTVSDEQADTPQGYDWFYSYTLDVFKFTPVTFMIETGTGFTAADLTGVALSFTGAASTNANFSYSVGWWEKEGDAQGDFLREMPERTYGILFSNTSMGGQNSDGSVTISFWSKYGPAWADLYSNCGGNGNRGWNAGFSLEDPMDAPSIGSINNHVLTPLPEPATTGLLIFAMAAMLGFRRLFAK